MNNKIKCIVWDLDNTIWDGVLLEESEVTLKEEIVKILEELDYRGIINSIASKNNYEQAMDKLKQYKIEQYFLYPQIGWSSKSKYIETISKSLNINVDSMMFIDDDIFELEEVRSIFQQILCINSSQYKELLGLEVLKPLYITEDSKRRRIMYLEDAMRKKEDEKYIGPKEDFLKSLNMIVTISHAKEEDLIRCEELTVRTNQLNSTGITYSFEELKGFINDEKYDLLICELTDRFGSYGKIGLTLIEKNDDKWIINLFITSCRVLSRGIGKIFLTKILKNAKEANVKVFARFKPTKKNKVMYATFKFMNFKDSVDDTNEQLFENDLSYIPSIPDYIDFIEQ